MPALNVEHVQVFAQAKQSVFLKTNQPLICIKGSLRAAFYHYSTYPIG
ncbi:hypothetical protein HMPREF9151_01515 [Hoylesella saccharolytica F0055]|uniref:Uncharacterized protein n=1 Tax=Hoylesella saccharolytica F0055 TaxID=1127699 RepID=L1N8R2_9BACT|nr:hypothetical protein HMPREF9151_01515 [Hoylesella saccharolytica F0055]